MKTIHSILLLVALSIAGAGSASEIRATVDGDLVNFPDVQPIMMNGRVMVPVRGVFEHMNANVDWDESNRTVTARRGNDTIYLTLNANSATINGERVKLDAPARFVRGRTMVPLRFLGESLSSSVEWIASTRTVEIATLDAAPIESIYAQDDNTYNSTIFGSGVTTAGYTQINMKSGTVVPFTLDEQLSSNESMTGDKFTASVDTGGDSNYGGLPDGTTIYGHVNLAREKTDKNPGVLGLSFDRIRLPGGQVYDVRASLISLDSKSVRTKNGQIVAKPGSSNNLKYIGYGAGAGAVLAVITKGNLVSNTLIGGALGYLLGEIQKNPSKSRDVVLKSGTRSGMKLTRNLAFRGMYETGAEK